MGSPTQTVTISTPVGNYVANNGVTPSAAVCQYGSGGTPTACDGGISVAGPGAATTIYLGVKLDTDGTQAAASTAAPSFTVMAVYN